MTILTNKDFKKSVYLNKKTMIIIIYTASLKYLLTSNLKFKFR